MKSFLIIITFFASFGAIAQSTGIELVNNQTVTLTTSPVEYKFNTTVNRMFPKDNQTDYNVRTICIEYKGTPTGEFFVAIGESMTAAHTGNGGHGVDNPRVLLPFRPGIDTFWLKGSVAGEKVFITILK